MQRRRDDAVDPSGKRRRRGDERLVGRFAAASIDEQGAAASASSATAFRQGSRAGEGLASSGDAISTISTSLSHNRAAQRNLRMADG